MEICNVNLIALTDHLPGEIISPQTYYSLGILILGVDQSQPKTITATKYNVFKIASKSMYCMF